MQRDLEWLLKGHFSYLQTFPNRIFQKLCSRDAMSDELEIKRVLSLGPLIKGNCCHAAVNSKASSNVLETVEQNIRLSK